MSSQHVWFAVLAGGGGTRLWPLSRRSRPKQFLPLLAGGETLLGATVRRLCGVVPAERILVVTAASQVEEVRRTAPAVPAENLVVEPVGRNTAPCIGLAALEAVRRDPQAILAVIPSDQHVSDEPRFVAALQQALAEAERGAVATIGIRPTHPETGYGYIRRADGGGEVGRPSFRASPQGVGRGASPPREGLPWETGDVRCFVEKPDRETAERYLLSGDYLWNGGMFFFPARRILDEIDALVPELGRILDGLRAEPGRLGELYPQAPATSIDYAVMEKLPGRPGGMRVVAGDFGWSDVGSWAALAEVRAPDGDGNTVLGEAVAIDSRRNILVGADRLVAVVGVEDLVVVAAGDAVLVLPRERAQDVRKVVAALEASHRETYL